jgi:putative ABC transport system permease protein
VVGSVIYRIAVGFALNSSALGLNASDLNLVTAVLVAIALILPGARNPLRTLLAGRNAAGKSPS